MLGTSWFYLGKLWFLPRKTMVFTRENGGFDLFFWYLKKPGG